LHICFDMAQKYPFSLSVFSVGILCKTGKRHWELGWVTKGWVALHPCSKDWEGRSPRQCTVGPGTPGVCSAPAPGACALGLTMAGSAGWWRGGSSFQDVGTGLSFRDLGAGELENFSEWVSWDAETELRVLKSNTQRVPPLDVGTSVSETYPWPWF
jgi:hypothetical protein